MITGATRGGGGRKLANHLADVKRHNVETLLGATRGLGATEIRAALRELDAGAAGGRTDRHAYHVHMDPGPAEMWTDDTRREAWARLEAEMGLADAAFVEVRHVTWRTLEPGDDLGRVRAVHGAEAMREKDGRHQVLMAHEHRVYDLTRDDGSVIDTAHDFARREKVGRVFEHDHGFDLVPGRHNRAVAAWLDDERPDVAAAIRAAQLTEGPRPQALISPKARAQAERTGVDPRTVGATVLAAWAASDGGAAFAAALREQGFTLAMGTKAAVVVDGAGGVHPLARMLGKESKLAGDRITAADVTARIGGLDLPRHDHAAGAPAPPAPAPAAPAVEPAGVPTLEKVAPAPEAAPSTGSHPGATRPLSGAASAGPPQAAAGGTASLSVRPFDPSREGDWLRFLNDSTAALNRQSAAALQGPTTPGRKPDDDAVKIGIRFGEAIHDAFEAARERAIAAREERAAPAADGEGLDRRGLAGDRGPDGERPGRVAEGDGPPRAVPDRVRGLPGGVDLGSPVAPAGPAGTPGGGEQDRDPDRGGGSPAGRPEVDPSRAGEDHGRPGRAVLDAGRDRAAHGRVEIALARHVAALDRIKQKTADLRNPAAAAARQRAAEQAVLNAQVSASRARVAAVMDTAPWPNPADRSRHRLQDAARDQVTAAKGVSEAGAVAAAAKAAEVRGRVEIVARVLAAAGLETPSVQAARDADRIAEEARRAAQAVRLDYRERLAHAERLGAAQAVRREEQQQGWERRPDVAAARREARGNDLVMAALKSGNTEIKDILKEEGGLRAAREMLLRQEAERVAEIQRQRQLQDQRAAAATALRPGPASPAPGMRR